MISGMGELHLEVIVDRLKREFKVEAAVGRPQVAYRETIRSDVQKVEGKFIRQTGGSGQYGVVYIDLEPAPGEGFDFINKIKGGAIPSEFIPAVEKGIEEALETGVKAGYPMVDVASRSMDGKYHDTDSSEMAFKIAGSMALKEAAQARQARAARAHDGGRGGHAAGLHRRRDRRPLPPPRPCRGPGAARQCRRGEGKRAAGRDVRVRDRPALAPRRAGPPTRCSSTGTRKSRTASRRRSSKHRTGEPVGASHKEYVSRVRRVRPDRDFEKEE